MMSIRKVAAQKSHFSSIGQLDCCLSKYFLRLCNYLKRSLICVCFVVVYCMFKGFRPILDAMKSFAKDESPIDIEVLNEATLFLVVFCLE